MVPKLAAREAWSIDVKDLDKDTRFYIVKLLAQRVELANQFSSFLGQVNGHLVVTLLYISKMLHLRHPRKWIKIQDNWSNFSGVNWLSGENYTLCFGFDWVNICAELQPPSFWQTFHKSLTLFRLLTAHLYCPLLFFISSYRDPILGLQIDTQTLLQNLLSSQ